MDCIEKYIVTILLQLGLSVFIISETVTASSQKSCEDWCLEKYPEWFHSSEDYDAEIAIMTRFSEDRMDYREIVANMDSTHCRRKNIYTDFFAENMSSFTRTLSNPGGLEYIGCCVSWPHSIHPKKATTPPPHYKEVELIQPRLKGQYFQSEACVKDETRPDCDKYTCKSRKRVVKAMVHNPDAKEDQPCCIPKLVYIDGCCMSRRGN